MWFSRFPTACSPVEKGPDGFSPRVSGQAGRKSSCFQALCALLIFWQMGPGGVAAALALENQRRIDEFQIKAVFLYNLVNFTTWPAHVFQAPAEPFRIVILGRDPFGGLLEKVVAGETYSGHPILVEHLTHLTPGFKAQMLFIDTLTLKQRHAAIAAVGQKPVLTVGDRPDFCQNGGMVGLVRKENRIRIYINLQAAKDSGLHLSSKLLRIAALVDGPDRGR